MWVFITITDELAQPAWTGFTPSVPMYLGDFVLTACRTFQPCCWHQLACITHRGHVHVCTFAQGCVLAFAPKLHECKCVFASWWPSKSGCSHQPPAPQPLSPRMDVTCVVKFAVCLCLAAALEHAGLHCHR